MEEVVRLLQSLPKGQSIPEQVRPLLHWMARVLQAEVKQLRGNSSAQSRLCKPTVMLLPAGFPGPVPF